MRAAAIASPALDRLARLPPAWRVLGVGTSTAYVGDDSFVVALTAPGVPRMPNGVALDRSPASWPPPGAAVRCSHGALAVGSWRVSWNAATPPVWNPSPSRATTAAALPALGERGRAVLAQCGVRAPNEPAALAAAFRSAGVGIVSDRGGSNGVHDLLTAVEQRDPGQALIAATALLGRGGGLTPEGDDLLCAVAATMARFGAAAGMSQAALGGWLSAVCPSDARGRSTGLSVTLLELAVTGALAEPADALLDLAAPGWARSLAALRAVGSSTGNAYALALGAAAQLLGPPAA